MNISAAWETPSGRGDVPGRAIAALLAATWRRIARAWESGRRRRAAREAARLDDRVLRDIGMTRLGLPERTLAGLNELSAAGG